MGLGGTTPTFLKRWGGGGYSPPVPLLLMPVHKIRLEILAYIARYKLTHKVRNDQQNYNNWAGPCPLRPPLNPPLLEGQQYQFIVSKEKRG